MALDPNVTERRQAGHRFVEHTADVELELRAATLPELFIEAGLALAELMIEPSTHATREVSDAVVVRASDPQMLLVKWLNELVFRAETRQAVFTRFRLREITGQRLVADISGPASPVVKTAVKAATYHRLRVANEDGLWTARVVLDV